MRAALAAFAVLLALSGSGQAEGEPDPLALLAERDVLCAGGAEMPACSLAEGRLIALVANAIAEAGQTLDRGAFIDLVRPYLESEAPELRATAAYALAKLSPDASDTPGLIVLLRDPASAVRDGAWAAAGASSDPAARLVVDRFPERVERNGYWPDPAPFDAGTLGLTLPEGLDYLWLSAPLRASGELQFLADRAPELLLDEVAELAGQTPVTPAEALTRWPGAPGRLMDFQDETLFGQAQVVPVLPSGAGSPTHYAVVYQDRLFAATGLTLIIADGREILPEPVEDVDVPDPALEPLRDALAFDAALVARAGAKPEAPAEETDLYLTITASGGAAAEAYLELFPDGAYAAEMRALIAAPRLVLDATRYPETGPVIAELLNLPEGSMADITVLGPEGYVAFAQTQEDGPVAIDISGRVGLGAYRVNAAVMLPDSDLPLVLWRDFSVEQAMAELRTAKTEFAPGETIEVEFLGMSGSDQDYVATVAAGASLNSFVAYAYTGGARDGHLTLPAPTEPGAYELRAFFREDESVLRASLPFSVAGSAAVSPQPEASSTASSTTIPDDSARAVLALDRSSYAPGATITVIFAGMSGSTSDYVSVAPVGAANSSYLQYAYIANGATEGVATLTAPNEPGTYEVRAIFRDDETILRGSVTFTVE